MAQKNNKYHIIFFLIGLAALGVMIYKLGVDTICDNIRKTGWWFVAIIGIWLIVYLINALAFTAIIRNKNIPKEQYPSFFRVLKISISGYAINYITPVVSLGGEPYRILELQENIGTRKATSCTLSYSMMHILSHIVFWMCSIILIITVLKPAWGLTLGCMVMFILFMFGIYFIFKGYRKGLIVKTFRILGKIPFMRKPVRRFSENKLQALQEIDVHIVAFYEQNKRTFFLSLGLEILARVISCFELLFIAKAIGIEMTLVGSIVLYAGSTLFANILFFSPMQLGTREGGLALTLKMMGLQGQAGIYMGLVMRIRELFWIAVGILLIRIKKLK